LEDLPVCRGRSGPSLPHGEVNSEDISHYFHLDDSDHNLIALHRGNHNRLGFAVQLCTVRYLGAFPEDLTETPATVVSILGRQLDIEDTTCFGEYCSSRQRWDHTARIRERGGYSDFSDGSIQFRLNRWLYALCWTGTDQPGMLFDRATAWLIAHKALLPGATVLELDSTFIYGVRISFESFSGVVILQGFDKSAIKELARTKTDNRGRYSLAVPPNDHSKLRTITVLHQDQRFSLNLDFEHCCDIGIYDVTSDLSGISADVVVRVLADDQTAGQMQIKESFYFKRETKPPQLVVDLSDRFEVILPSYASHVPPPDSDLIALSLEPAKAKNHYRLKGHLTVFPSEGPPFPKNVNYRLFRNGDRYVFNRLLTVDVNKFTIIFPKGLTLKQNGTGLFVRAFHSESPNVEEVVAPNLHKGQMLDFQLEESSTPKQAAPVEPTFQTPASSVP
jgi:Domain of unknown function (DUF4158)